MFYQAFDIPDSQKQHELDAVSMNVVLCGCRDEGFLLLVNKTTQHLCQDRILQLSPHQDGECVSVFLPQCSANIRF